jgi:Rieske Fe-S protein
MTNGTAAAMILRDLLEGRENSWAKAFDARRALTSIPEAETVKHNVHVAKTWMTDRLGGSPAGSADDVTPGQAAVIEMDGESTAVHRDEAGSLHAVSAVCTHMGCTVAWNDGEKSWDCPCHGSRFSPDGAVLHGPAVEPLECRPDGHRRS